MEPVYIGTGVNIAGEFRDAAGALFDPPSVVFKIHKPDGTEASYTYGVQVAVVRTSIGKYNMWTLPDQVGLYISRLVSSGASGDHIANESSFLIVASRLITP